MTDSDSKKNAISSGLSKAACDVRVVAQTLPPQSNVCPDTDSDIMGDFGGVPWHLASRGNCTQTLQLFDNISAPVVYRVSSLTTEVGVRDTPNERCRGISYLAFNSNFQNAMKMRKPPVAAFAVLWYFAKAAVFETVLQHGQSSCWKNATDWIHRMARAAWTM